MPDVTGETVIDAAAIIQSVDADASVFVDSSYWASELGLELEDTEVLDATAFHDLLVVSTDPEAGSHLEPGAEVDTELTYPVPKGVPAAQSWMADCGGFMNDFEEDLYFSLDSFWKDNQSECTFETIPGREFEASKQETKALAAFDAKKTDVEAYLQLLETCGTWSEHNDVFFPERKELKAAAILCPESPEHELMAAWGAGQAFKDGDYIVGEEITPGTYRSDKGVKDCYWERITPNGDIIANNFITHAAQGALVTLYAGESFTTERCGTRTTSRSWSHQLLRPPLQALDLDAVTS